MTEAERDELFARYAALLDLCRNAKEQRESAALKGAVKDFEEKHKDDKTLVTRMRAIKMTKALFWEGRIK